MSRILEEYEDRLWDDRNWIFVQKAKNPMAVFEDISRNKREAPPVDISTLPTEQRDWLRAK